MSTDLVHRVNSDEFKAQVVKVLPEGMGVERFTRIALTALMENPKLASAEPTSVFRSLLRAAQDGLLPDGREAALVLFKNEAQYMPMIGGYRKIAGEGGWTVRTAVVYENDEFHYELGTKPDIKHVPCRPGHDRGAPIGAYAVGDHSDGRREIEVMDVAAIDKRREVSRSKDGPWKTWPDEMAEKTVGRRLFKKLPLEGARVKRLALDELVEGEAAEILYGNGVQVPALSPSSDEPDSEGANREPAQPSDEAGGDGVGDDPLTGDNPVPQPAEQESFFNAPEGALTKGAEGEWKAK